MARIHHIVVETTSLGPGKRSVVWFQGCKKRCPNCINQDGQPLDGGFELDNDDIFENLVKNTNLNGVTISGGEPFLQWEDLRYLVNRIKSETKLDIMLFSGYKFEELLPTYGENFFNLIDLFIDGDYQSDLNENQTFRGSQNQQIYSFTGKYTPVLQQILNNKNRSVEFQFIDNHEPFMVGIPPRDFYENLITEIRKED